MEQVEQYDNGERDYTQIKGGTGPLVYPAAHVYIYWALYHITDKGTNILLAQRIFGVLYLGTLSIVMACYRRAKVYTTTSIARNSLTQTFFSRLHYISFQCSYCQSASTVSLSSDFSMIASRYSSFGSQFISSSADFGPLVVWHILGAWVLKCLYCCHSQLLELCYS